MIPRLLPILYTFTRKRLRVAILRVVVKIHRLHAVNRLDFEKSAVSRLLRAELERRLDVEPVPSENLTRKNPDAHFLRPTTDGQLGPVLHPGWDVDSPVIKIILDAVALTLSTLFRRPETFPTARPAPFHPRTPLTPLTPHTHHPNPSTRRTQQLERHHCQLCRPAHALRKAHIYQHVILLRPVQLTLRVVLPPLRLIRQRLIRARDRTERIRRRRAFVFRGQPGHFIWVVLERQLSVRFFNLIARRLGAHSQGFVRVRRRPGRIHRSRVIIPVRRHASPYGFTRRTRVAF